MHFCSIGHKNNYMAALFEPVIADAETPRKRMKVTTRVTKTRGKTPQRHIADKTKRSNGRRGNAS